MASCTTSQWATAAPQIKLTVTQSASTDTSATLSWTLQYIAASAAQTNGKGRSYSIKIGGTTVKSGTYNINGKKGTYTIASGTRTINKTTATRNISFSCSMAFNVTWSGSYGGTKSASGSISISAKTSYTVTFNANGGSGAPGKQTKWHGTALTLSSAKPTRTGYSFLGWSTSSSATSATWSAGGSYTANASDTLYAVWKANTYTVSFNANGGSGAPGNQTKTYGKTLTLSSTKPTRTNYTFKGWGTSASSTTATYQPGGSYTANTAIKLYAIWTLNYKKPRITKYFVRRCDEYKEPDESGTYALVDFNWACDRDVSSIKIEWKLSVGSTWSNSVTVTATGKSGSVNQLIGAGAITTESSYDVRIAVADSGGTTYLVQSISTAEFILDILSGGHGIAFGKTAELSDIVDFGFMAKFSNGLSQPVLSYNTDLNSVTKPNIYVGNNITNGTYLNAPIAKGTFTLYVDSSGPSGQIRQRLVLCDKSASETWERQYYASSWGDWIRTSDFSGKILWTGSYYMSASQTATLSEPVSKQPRGIVLIFSEYTDGAYQDYSFISRFVPKKVVSVHSGKGHSFNMFSSKFAYCATKYLYIADSKIVGNDANTATGTADSGIKYTNNKFVLRYVIGV